MKTAISEAKVLAMLTREKALFIQRNPKSKGHSENAARNWLGGVPMHWMVDWGTPFPLFIEKAQGVDLTDADGNSYIDFCLGDTGAMFGHSPKPVVDTLLREGAHGFTTMLPSASAVNVGKLLQDRFKLPAWQITATASDANRAVLRWCRAITGRKKILVFNHCYHGAVDETYVNLDHGKPEADRALIGEPNDLTQLTKVIEFNDIPALEAALAPGDVACVLAEPIMTNVGMVLPDDGFHKALRDITRPSILQYRAIRLSEGAAETTIHKELVVLRRALAEAGLEGIVPRTAVRYRPRERHLTQDEFVALVEELQPARQLWLYVAVYGGLRAHELEILEWAHVDFARGWLRVPGTKTAGSFRRVPIAVPLRQRLAVADHTGDLVLAPWPNYRRDLRAACKRAGIAPVSANDLRRTFAS